jgi:hypothetical protein
VQALAGSEAYTAGFIRCATQSARPSASLLYWVSAYWVAPLESVCVLTRAFASYATSTASAGVKFDQALSPWPPVVPV